MKESRNILRERAVKNALVHSDQTAQSETKYLLFRVVKQLYAIEQKWVKEVVKASSFTDIPGVPHFVKGVVNVRGNIYSTVNISSFLAQKDYGLSELNKLILISNGDIEYALIADEVMGFTESLISLKSQIPDNYSELYKEFVEGICPNGALILNGVALTESKLIIIE